MEHFVSDGRCAQCVGVYIPHEGCVGTGTLKLTPEMLQKWKSANGVSREFYKDKKKRTSFRERRENGG